MILLWGLPAETPLALVRDALEGLGCRTVLFDQRAVLDTAVELAIEDGQLRGALRTGRQAIELGEVTAVYLRPYDVRDLPILRRSGAGSPAWQHAIDIEETLWSWVELTPALVVNRPSAQSSNNSKPYQAAHIRRFGFQTPETLITTDPVAVREFWAKHGTVIYKSISGVRSIVSRLGPEHHARLDHVRWCPTQFQEHIAGTDYRVHVVGDEIFTCEIVSDAADYRYAGRQGAKIDIRAYELPADCVERCHALATAMGLLVAGVDLRRTPEGAWYCFEVNPSPGFSFFQEATGQPIAEAIARLLAS
jgi:hypothetical protein